MDVTSEEAIRSLATLTKEAQSGQNDPHVIELLGEAVDKLDAAAFWLRKAEGKYLPGGYLG